MGNVQSILLVDDDPDDQHLFRAALQEVDSSVVLYMASNGVQALEALDQGLLPDVIVLDLNMPKVDGRELLHTLKRTGKFIHLSVIIYSTSASQRDIEESLAMGAISCVVKPLTFEMLRSFVGKVVERKWQQFTEMGEATEEV